MASCAGVRGIRNISGVSCHISAALQLIHHGLPELRQSLIRLADAYASGGCGRNEDDGFDSDPPKTVLFVYQLGILFKNLSSPDVEENGSTDDIAAPKAVDPMPLYEVLPPALNYQDVGDAATALRAILTTIRSELEEMCNSQINTDEEVVDDAKNSLDACLSGSIAQRIEGTMRTTDADASGNKIMKLLKRRKPDKERKMTVPFPIPVRRCACLDDSLRSITTDAQVINGYDWEAVEEYVQSETILETAGTEEDAVSSSSSSDSSESSSDTSSSDSYSSSNSENCGNEEGDAWKTSKYALLNKVPQYLFIHLMRFEYKGGRIQKLSSVLDVPKKLDIGQYSVENGRNNEFDLYGAIAYIDEPIDGANDIDEDAGHYISYVRLRRGSNGNSETDSIRTQMTECKLDSATNGCESNTSGGIPSWLEINDEQVKSLDGETGESHVLNVLSGRYSKKIKGRSGGTGSKYATVLLYRRVDI